MSIRKPLMLAVVVPAALILGTAGCSDMGDEPKTTPPSALLQHRRQ